MTAASAKSQTSSAADAAPGPDRCPLCGQHAECVFTGHPAFAAPGRFDVWECEGCDSRFAWPLRSSSELYERIYRVASQLPGYDRYARYRELLPGSDRPLDLLAEQEDVYWGVREAMRALLVGGERPRVLEIGSGMGYLAYALHRAGCDVVGIDHSAEAVAQATRAFGPLYRVAPAESLAGSDLGAFDVVIATELVEHLEDPLGFVRDASSRLVPGGRLILTTPNRDLYPRALAWHTDPAPVHLWWFSKTSLRRMAWACGLLPSFVDFAPFHGRPPVDRYAASKPQSLDADGRVIFRDTWLNTVARGLMARWPGLSRPIGRVFLARLNRAVARERLGRESLSLCAVFRADPELTTSAPRVPVR